MSPRYSNNQTSSSAEPFGYWLFARKDLSLKVLAVMAIFMLMLAGIVTAKNATDANRRNSAWSEMMKASQQGNDDVLIAAAERFFSSNPVNDARTDEALQIYQGALLRWFSSLQGPPGPNVRQHLNLYRKFAAAHGNGGRI